MIVDTLRIRFWGVSNSDYDSPMIINRQKKKKSNMNFTRGFDNMIIAAVYFKCLM